ncbi:hypothetical protein IGI04_041346 [Brassica rapa subsp. trilocularis]|uniref:Uncharacterized protein n=1 Tax=Brassica rapa subsp. trilocularis TaxID=1813537 RepID=A0ABQ7KTE2_BRACM|nr:hypothetical protein IGI04_041346 [Brassica rapa subsp. trilocularis]
MELLPAVHQKALETCPFPSTAKSEESAVSVSLLETYAEGRSEWPMFEWMHVDCFANLLQLACMLPQKEDHLRNRITKFFLAVSESFGSSYLTHIELPVFLVAVGDDEADLRFLPSSIHPRIKGLKPRTAVASRLAALCILPLLLAGVLGAPSKHEELTNFLRQLLVESNTKENQSSKHNNNEVLDAVRFLCTFEQHHNMIFGILWEMVVDSTAELKINAAKVLKTLIFQLSASPSSSTDVIRRRDRDNAFCEAIRALDATDLSQTSVREYLLPAIQNLFKDPDTLDPAHKEALEIIMKERSGGLLVKKEATETTTVAPSSHTFQGPDSPKAVAAAAEDNRFRRIMRGNFSEMLRSKAKNPDETPPQNH